MGNVFNLIKCAQSYNKMDSKQLQEAAKRVMSNSKDPEFNKILDEVATRFYIKKDPSFKELTTKMTNALSSESTPGEIAEYEKQQISKTTEHQGLNLLSKINLEAYKIVNANIGRITSLDPKLKQTCNLDFMQRFMSNYSTSDSSGPGTKKNIGQFFLDRFANQEIRRNIFTKYDFFGYNPTILAYYAKHAYFKDSNFIKKINSDLHDQFNSHFSQANISWLGSSGRDYNDEYSLHRQMSRSDFYFGSNATHSGIPLGAQKVISNESNESKDFGIIVLLNHFYELLKKGDEYAVCFVLNQFMERVRYSIKSEEYCSDPNRVQGASEAGINFMRRTLYYVSRDSIFQMQKIIDEKRNLYTSLEKMQADASGESKRYIAEIATGLSQCIENADSFISSLVEWQNFQSGMYSNQDRALNFLDIIVNKKIQARNPAQVSLDINKGSFCPFDYISKNGLVSLRFSFKATENSVQPEYEYSIEEDCESQENNGFQRFSPKREIIFNKCEIKVAEYLASKIDKNASSQGFKLCFEAKDIPAMETIGIKNLAKHGQFSADYRNANGYYALDEKSMAEKLAEDGELEERLSTIVDDIKSYMSSNIFEIFKITDMLKEKKISLPPVPAKSEGIELLFMPESLDRQSKVAIAEYHNSMKGSLDHSKYSLEALMHFHPHQGIVIHQILLDLENSYRNYIAELNKELGLTDDALECYESIGRIAISSKLSEIDNSINKIDIQDPKREELVLYKERLEKVQSQMEKIFRGIKSDGLERTNWSSAGTSHRRVRGKPFRVAGGEQEYLLYQTPQWLYTAVSLDKSANDQVAALDKEAEDLLSKATSDKEKDIIKERINLQKEKIKSSMIVPLEIVQNIIKTQLDTLSQERVLDIGAMLKIVYKIPNNQADSQEQPMECGLPNNRAGKAIGLSVARAIDTRKITPEIAKQIGEIFYQSSRGDGLAYLLAIKDKIEKTATTSCDNAKVSTSIMNKSCINYSINDWTKFMARRIYLGG